MVYAREVTIPLNAQVYVEQNKFKTDKIILGKKISIWSNYEICKNIVAQNGLLIKHVKKHTLTNELKEIAVGQNGLALQYLDFLEQTDKICEIAVKQNGLALKYSIWQTNLICELAVK
jgi:hypothetical protein